jgi:uncharacterized protein (TIGR00369 family)
MKPVPEHGKCFVCGEQNPHGIGIRWFLCDDGALTGQIALNDGQQGPPGHAHGGALAALLDEAMGLAVWAAGLKVAAVNLNVDFRRPVPLGQPITVTGRVAEQSGRAIHSEGEIRLPDGEIAAAGRGVYVEAPHLFETINGLGASP